jgi:hypothetical protein
VVSHQFAIAGWDADRTETVWAGTESHQIFAWVVPPR